MSPTKQRSLGPTESFFAFHQAYGSMTVVNALVIQGAIDVQRLGIAINKLKATHAVLNMQTVLADDQWHYVDGANTPIELKISNLSPDQTWQTIVEEESAKPFETDPSKPLVRFHLIRQNSDQFVLLLVGSHAFLDGVSSICLQDQLLEYYLNPKQVIEERKLKPSMDQLLDHIDVPGDLLPFDAPLEDHEVTPVVDRNDTTSDQRIGRFFSRTIDKETADKLIRTCREKGITLNPLIYAAAQIAIYRINQQQEPLSIACGGNSNMRSLCQPSPQDEDLGCYVSMFGYRAEVTPETSLWELAEFGHKKLTQRFSSYSQVNTTRYPFWKDFLSLKHLDEASKTRQGRFSHFHLSNLGKVKLKPRYGNLQINAYHFLAGQQFLGTIYWMGAASIESKLCLSFSTVEPMLSKEKTEAWVNLTVEILTQPAQKLGQDTYSHSLSN